MAKIIAMPSLSPSMEEGVLESWEKQVGDFVESGNIIAQIETDKAVVEYEVLDDGYLRHFFIQPGDKVLVGAPIAILSESKDEDIKQLLKEAPTQEAKAPAPIQPDEDVQARAAVTPDTEVAPPTPKVEQAVTPKPSALSSHIRSSPLARKIANERGLDLSEIQGSGPHGRIIKADLENLKQTPSTQSGSTQRKTIPTSSHFEVSDLEGEYEEHALTGMRKAIANRLLEATQSIPHFYLTVQVKVDSLLKARKELNMLSEVKISVNDLIIKASSNALMKHPQVNSRFTDTAIVEFKNTHIGFAVATPEGLITPIVRYVNQMSLSELATTTKDMAERGRNKKLSIDEFTGGTFGTSNLGMFGIDQFTAIINPPQACNLAISQASDVLELQSDGTVSSTKQMKLTLSCDHRVVDGATGAQFLKTLKQTLENPISFAL